MLKTFASQFGDSSNITYSLHTLSPKSAQEFTETLPSPSEEDSGRKLTPPRADFDVATANLVLHHVDDIPSFLSGCMGLLKDGGWLVMTEFGREEGKRDLVGEWRDKSKKEVSMA
jgi:SAM-dependent methyltransferase